MTKLISLKHCLILAFACFSFFAQAQTSKMDHVELKEASIRDAVRILSSLSGANITVTQEASNKTVNLLLQDVTLKHAIETLSRITGLWYRHNSNNNSYLIMTKKEYQSDIITYRKDSIRSFTLKHQNVRATAQTIKDLFGDRVILKEQNDQDDFDGLPDSFRVEGKEVTTTDNNNNRISTTVTTRNSSSQLLGDNQEITSIQSGITDENIADANLRQLTSQVQTPNLNIDKNLGISTPIYIATNRIHNFLYVRTSDDEAMDEIAKLIQTSDKPTPQVLLETKIVAIDNNTSRDLQTGFEFDGITIGRSSNITAGVHSSFYEAFSDTIKFKINALEKDNKATTISKPILLASNNRPARIFIGQKQVIAQAITGNVTTTTTDNVITSTDNRTLTVEEVNIGNTLAIQPSINADGTVTLDIQQITTRIIENGLQYPVWDTDTATIVTQLLPSYEESSIRTIAIAKDGSTIALGGNIVTQNGVEVSKIPGLGDLPVLGKLFSSESKSENKSQYIMLITPHIINNPYQGNSASNKISEVNALQKNSTSDKPNQHDTYLYLNRFAANAMRGLRLKDNSINSYPVPNSKFKLFSNPSIQNKIIANYRQDQLYVSVLQLSNSSSTSQPIDLQQLSGSWLSAAREQPFLAAKGTQIGAMRDSSYLYLISNTPFDQAAGNYLK